MISSYTYLAVNFMAVIICFIFSFHPAIQFNRQFSAFIKSSLICMIPFILWDIWFTKEGVWWFDKKYTLGITLIHLPLEEWLFFICIPFACIFTYYCLNKFLRLDRFNRWSNFVVFIVVAVCTGIAVFHYQKMYPFFTALVAAAILLCLQFLAKAKWIGKATVAYVLLLPGFFLINGILTGTGLESPVVNYNPNEILNIRLLTIPVEDSLYGYALFMINVYFFQRFQKPEVHGK